MNPNVIVLCSADPSVQQTVAAAVTESRHGLRLAVTPEAAVNLLVRDHSDVDLYIIDLDEDIHGVSLLAGLTCLEEPAPIVLLTSFEPNYCSRLAAATGVRACLGKPVTKEEIVACVHRLTDSRSFTRECASLCTVAKLKTGRT